MVKNKRNKKIEPQPTIQNDNGNASVQLRIPFDVWWAQYRMTHQCKRELKEAVYQHFKSRGFLETGDWENGIKDFGLK